MPVTQRLRPKRTLGERIADLATPQPDDFDPENIGDDSLAEAGDAGRLSDMESNASADDTARDHYVAVDRSVLRRNLMLKMDDTKYSGKRVSRKALLEDMDSEEDSSKENDSEMDDNNALEEIDASSSVDSAEDSEVDQHTSTDSDTSSDQDDDSDDVVEDQTSDNGDDHADGEDMMATLARLQKDEGKMIKAMTQAAQADVEKGRHVRAQLAMWDSLLDIRIRLQKAIDMSNCLPQHNVYAAYHNAAKQVTADSNVDSNVDAVKEASSELAVMLEDLITLRLELVSKNPTVHIDGINNISRKRKHLPADSTDTTWIKELWDDSLAPLDVGFVPFRDETIDKWNNKVQIANGIPLHKKFKVVNQSIVSQIHQISQDRDRLIKRTRLIRTPLNILGKEEAPSQLLPTSANEELRDKHLSNFDAEIFDDGDYYQQLLKELIESRTADSDDPVLLAVKFAQLKQMKNKQGKKSVDTRASKGRKVRYHVHEKIQNFMASEPRGTWHEEMVSELFSSLFGRKFKDSSVADATGETAVQNGDGSPRVSGPITIADGFKILG
ncbi:hypothetical protein BASA50_004988 [Batrachochytrium salamandrivorans]|uniref:Protein BFR2 n=1 Tax=Batrachochytrium salamandrivorans TaxID=1357716 RepID=A0ABQ8FE37_9FUNG|nr:hypothetical protein BASA60_003242 [Batrachochytrium salamandrivorans]KAH6591827.1 hypothetical protein BASA61_004781 [Batrachochytrium salamandrivorans]KAH6596657.1 hypothetical protein BASA50_004988 [Batrachochytrium salamandrivorans]KAH9248550.1 hypothetical protein BASA81_013734 [Batrachochytrium salamandrivorans]KAH9270454.1 hypothetical protein BASA83_007454 [Batrachochytrium salamandrivorans]